MTRSNALISLLCVLLAVLLATAVFSAVRVVQISGNVAQDQQQTTQALCAFRRDLQTRVQSGEDFLATHPKGILGIPAPTLQTSIDNEQHTLNALSPLVCPN